MIPRAPFSALPGERLAGIGHNNGPSLDGARRWRAHCWKRAKAQIMPRAPLEVVRRRMRRAAQLGLGYPEYASILLGTGHDVRALLFTAEALGLQPRQPLADRMRARLDAISRCERLLLVRHGLDADAMAAISGIAFEAQGTAPPEAAPLRAGAEAIHAIRAPRRLPGDTVVMIGTKAVERDWADAARLARFLPAARYLGTTL